MKTDEATVLIAQALQDRVSNQPKDLSEVLKIPIIQVHNVLSKLNKDGLIEIGEDEKGKIYTLKNLEGLQQLTEVKKVEPETPKVEKKVAEPKLEKKVAAPKQESKAPEPAGRHTGKFIYNKVPYSKSACALKVVTDYVEKEKPSLKQLRAAFPDDIISRFGVVNELKAARDLSKDRNRYHLHEHQILTTSDGKNVVVCNQFSIDRFLRFCEAAAVLGYKIKPE